MYNVQLCLILGQIKFVGLWIKWPLDSFSVLVSIHVDQVAARFIQRLSFNVLKLRRWMNLAATWSIVHNPHSQRWLKHLAALRLGRPKTELSERFLPVFPAVFLLLTLENVRLFGSSGLLFQSLRTVGDGQFRDIRNIKLSQAEPKRCCLRIWDLARCLVPGIWHWRATGSSDASNPASAGLSSVLVTQCKCEMNKIIYVEFNACLWNSLCR